MLDEPLGSLDRSLRERLTVELRDLFRTLGITTITVTHDQGEAFTIADRVAVMRAGRLVQIGSAQEVWQQPADGFVARFLGFTNVFDVDVRQGRAVSPAGTFTTERGDGPACVVLRPDAVSLAPPATADVEGEALPPGFRGDHFSVPVSLQTGAVIEVVVRSGGVPEAGERVGLRVEHGAVLVVDREPPQTRFMPTPGQPKE